MRRLLEAAGRRRRAAAYVTEPKIDGLAISLVYERRRARARRHARRRDRRRGRHRQPAHDAHGAPAPARQGERRRRSSRCAARSTCRSPPSRASTRSGRQAGLADLHEPAQLRGRVAAPARLLADGAAARLRSGRYAVGGVEGVAPRVALGGARPGSRAARLPRQPADRARTTTSSPCATRACALEERRASLDYEIDGVVVKVDSLAMQDAARRRRPRPSLGDRASSSRRRRAPRSCSTSASTSGAPATLNPFAVLEPGGRRRRHRQARDAAQRGRHPPQGHPRSATRSSCSAPATSSRRWSGR